MNDLTIKIKELPNTILGFYTNINNCEYIILNDKSKEQQQLLAYLGCMYYKKQGCFGGKITIDDIDNENFEPIKYAKEKLKMILGE